MQRIKDKLLLSTRLSAKLALAGMLGFSAIGIAGAQEAGTAPAFEPLPLPSLELQSGQEDPTQSTITMPEGNIGPAHIFPSITNREALAAVHADSGPLLYHSGGKIMGPTVTIYVLYWTPSHLQTGAPTSFPSSYEGIEANMLYGYMGKGLSAIATQYYQISGGVSYVQNKGGLAAHTYYTTTPYPPSACSDSDTPGNCITDAQLQAEVQSFKNFLHASGGLKEIFMVFTEPGEGSCLPGRGGCAYTDYCAYHSHYMSGSTPVIYSNEPYGDPSYCQVSGAPSPNGDLAADTAATAASHELTEAITDPLGNAWFTSLGNEIGDLCAYNYGNVNWDGGNANQMWNGHFFLLQTEFSNHTGQCLNTGP